MKQYSIDPTMISLEEFRKLTAGRNMLPGRVALQEDMEERFGVLKESGITNLGDLLSHLSSKSRIESFSAQTGLSINYLVLLRREAGSYIAKSFPLSSFPGIPFEYVELLKSRGMKNTKNFYEQVQTEQKQAVLSASTGIPSYRLKELLCLCDLSRITGVGGVFSRVLYEAGINSTAAFAGTDASTLLERCRKVIEKHGYAVGNLGEEDMNYGIHYARVVDTCDNKRDNT